MWNIVKKQGELETELQKITNEKNQLEAKLTLTKNELKVIQDKNIQLQTEKEKLVANIKELEDNNTQNQEQINIQQEDIATQGQTIIELRNQLKEKQAQIEKLNYSLTELTSKKRKS